MKIEEGYRLNGNKFISSAQETLSAYLGVAGSFIYSARQTLKRNDLVVYGFNPGLDPDDQKPETTSLSHSIQHFQTRNFSLIDKGRWRGRNGKSLEPGKARYQLNVACVLKALGQTDALVTNLYFTVTRGVKDLLASDD